MMLFHSSNHGTTRSPNRSHSSDGGTSGSGLLRLLPGRSKSHGAERRVSELNIMGHESLVSAKYTMEKLKEAQKNTRVTKLELEDLINRTDGSSSSSSKEGEQLYEGVRNLLAGTSSSSNRSWQYIKFVDSITINNTPSGQAEVQWRHYANRKQILWDHIGRYAKNKPIMFQVKLEIAMGTSVTVLRSVLRVLHGLKVLTRIDCGGALFGIKKSDIPETLADLCSTSLDDSSSDSSSSSNNSFNEPCLRDTIVFDLSCMAPDSAPVNKAVVFLRKCNRSLRTLTANHNNKTHHHHHHHDDDEEDFDNDDGDDDSNHHDTSAANNNSMDRSLDIQDLVEANDREKRQRRSHGSHHTRLNSSYSPPPRNSGSQHHRRSPKRSRTRQLSGGSADFHQSLGEIQPQQHQSRHKQCVGPPLRRSKSHVERGSVRFIDRGDDLTRDPNSRRSHQNRQHQKKATSSRVSSSSFSSITTATTTTSSSSSSSSSTSLPPKAAVAIHRIDRSPLNNKRIKHKDNLDERLFKELELTTTTTTTTNERLHRSFDDLNHHRHSHAATTTKAPKKKKCPDYDWDHNRRGSASCSKLKISKRDLLHGGEDEEDKPDFRWDKQQQLIKPRKVRSISPRRGTTTSKKISHHNNDDHHHQSHHHHKHTTTKVVVASSA